MTTETKPAKPKARAKSSKRKPSDWLVLKAYSGILYNKKTEKYRARITSPTELNANGNPLQIVRTADTLEEALAIKLDLLNKIGKGGKEKIAADRMTFAQLVTEFSTTLTPAVYDDDPRKAKHEKLSGLAGWEDGLRVMRMFVEYFGNKPIRSISAEEIRAWKAERYATRRGKNKDLKRTLAGVNGELRFLRKAFGFAIQKGWLDRNPFTGAKLINSKFETKREIALTVPEETQLLEACDHPFLKMLLIFLFDTGMRLGEARGLTRRMIKLNQGRWGHLYLNASITKGKERRNLPVLTPRLRQVIEQRLAIIPNSPDELLFGKDSIRFGWDTTRERAKLQRNGEPLEVELRDTRHTWITRAVPSGIPLPEAMLYSGHKVVETFLRYLQPDQAEHNANAERFSAYVVQGQAAAINQTTETEMVN